MCRLFLTFQFTFCLCWPSLSNIFPNQEKEILNLHWYTSTPFIYEDASGQLVGIEPDMLRLFQKYLKEEEGIELELNWIKANSFSHILSTVKEVDDENTLGVSALSVTDDRRVYADFTNTYLPDITVLVSSKGTPIVRSFEEMNEMMRKLDAVTIRDTKYETLLSNLRNQLNVDFEIIYIESEDNVISGVSEANNRFGFIDLPVYLMLIKGGGEVTRQNFFTVQGQGYAYMLPQNSKWKHYLNDFLASPKYKDDISEILSNYLGAELYQFIDNIYTSGEELETSILTKEKELQLALIKNANLKLEEEKAFQRILWIGVIIISAFLFIVAFLFYNNQKTTRLLMKQSSQIEDQQEDISVKNEQLMNRNAQLVALNEEKNNLVKILAHDIRSPVSQIMMISDIINEKLSKDLSETETKMLKQVSVNAERINQMVTKILDVDGLEEHHIKVMSERVDVRTIMLDIANRYRPLALKKSIDFVVEFCENHNIIRTDHLLLLLVLENLVSNAVKFSRAGTMVSLIAKCKYDNVIFMIIDEGPGFSEEDKQKLFNRFQKLSAKPTSGETSTGLGLSIVKKYVQDLGGKVWVESEEGKGSTFFVKLTAI